MTLHRTNLLVPTACHTSIVRSNLGSIIAKDESTADSVALPSRIGPCGGLDLDLTPLIGRQPPVSASTGQDRLRREMATLRQQLTAAENQLTIANRERGRLQQQVNAKRLNK